MWFIRSSFIFLFHVVLFDQFYQSDAACFETFFVRDPENCRVRCNLKHGYFVDQGGPLQPVTSSNIKWRVKCSCQPSKPFMDLVRARFGGNKEYAKCARGILANGPKSRAKMSKIQFVSADEYQKTLKCVGSKSSRSPASSPGRGDGDAGALVTVRVQIEGGSTLITTGANKKEALAAMAEQIVALTLANPNENYKTRDITPELKDAMEVTIRRLTAENPQAMEGLYNNPLVTT